MWEGVDLDVVDPALHPRYKKVSKSRSLLGKRLESLDAQMKKQKTTTRILSSWAGGRGRDAELQLSVLYLYG